MVFKDQLNKTLLLTKVPQRIVCLVPSLTELLCDLGLETQIVGVTKFCVHPEPIRSVAQVVGGTKQVNVKKIQALKPDIILLNKEENTLEMANQCAQIAPIHVSDVHTLDQCLELIAMYGAIFKVAPRAQQITVLIKEKAISFLKFVKQQPTLKVAYFIWKDPWMVVSHQTFISYLLQLNGFENRFNTALRYPEVTLDDPRLKEVDCLLLSSEPYPFKNEHKRALLNQFPDKQVWLVDGEMFSWYGSRLLQAFDYFKTLRGTMS